MLSKTFAIAGVMVLALLSDKSCDTPGGNSKSLNRRESGVVTGTDISSCGNGLFDKGLRRCAHKCFDTSFKCDYEISVKISNGNIVSFDDATYDEYKGCTGGTEQDPKRWPGCGGH